ncbi:hypothetical protein [Ruminiclostridium cellobioparum]|uniref:hypothetical protein n=1 Tax=Ruminiclostridium cellobioparum TaxID=29355 RepID=UPI000484E5F6|nr:hypothetical protein [Ruminiclostridium cellobioparum]
MSLDLELNNEFKKVKHSKLGVITFIIFISMLVPFITILAVRFGIIKLDHDFALIVRNWIIFAPIVSLILSIIDLKRPNRSRALPNITLILSSVLLSVRIILSFLSRIEI